MKICIEPYDLQDVDRGSLIKSTSFESTNLLHPYFDTLCYFLGGIQCSSFLPFFLSNDKHEARFKMSFRVGKLIWA